MEAVDFHHGLRQYRLTDWMACHVGFGMQAEVNSVRAAIILRAALAGSASVLAMRIRGTFPEIDGGRAGVSIFDEAALADRVGSMIYRRKMLLLVHDELAVGLTPGLADVAEPVPMTADLLRAAMPGAGTHADTYAEVLEAAMTANGIDTWQRRAAFLGQIATETSQLNRVVENLNYSAQRLMVVWPTRFPTLESATPYANNPEALANHVYGGRTDLGNGNAASGDGWRYRGRGLIQLTGRYNYTQQGFANNPQDLAVPETAANTAAAYWASRNLNSIAQNEFTTEQEYNAVSAQVNTSSMSYHERWLAYQRAVAALKPAGGPVP